MTLKKTWEECLRMWYWIVQEWSRDTSLDPEDLKEEWIALSEYCDLDCDCFFCDYAYSRAFPFEGVCDDCPARQVDPSFECCNGFYNYRAKPDKFLKKITQLYNKKYNTRKRYTIKKGI